MAKIIAFEGIDGTGKSVQMACLSETLKKRGLKVKEISFPMYDTFFGEMVGRYLSAKDGIAANTVDGKSMALWFALDRFEAFRSLDYSDCDRVRAQCVGKREHIHRVAHRDVENEHQKNGRNGEPDDPVFNVGSSSLRFFGSRYFSALCGGFSAG